MLNMKTRVYTLLALSFFLTRCSVPTDEKKTEETLIIISPLSNKKLQVATLDIGKKSNRPATELCNSLGDGWRMPTKDELIAMYEQLHKNGKGHFQNNGWYWSSTKYYDYGDPVIIQRGESHFSGNSYWSVYFGTVNSTDILPSFDAGGNFELNEYFVRPVRDL